MNEGEFEGGECEVKMVECCTEMGKWRGMLNWTGNWEKQICRVEKRVLKRIGDGEIKVLDIGEEKRMTS